MAGSAVAPRPDHPTLDNLTLARKEGWAAFVNAAPRRRPESLTRSAISALGDAAANEYNLRRREWHANLGPLKTPQLVALHEDLWDILDSNLQDGDKAKSAVAIDAFPGLGKTTAAWRLRRIFICARSPSADHEPPAVMSGGRCAGSG